MLDQFRINFRQLRANAGRDAIQVLQEKAGVHISTYEGQLQTREPGLASVLRIAHTLGGSVEDLTHRIYWHPSRFAYPDAEHQDSTRHPAAGRLLPGSGAQQRRV